MVSPQGVLHGELRPYIVLGSGPGERIDYFVTADPTGRYAVVQMLGRFVLMDMRAKTRTTFDVEASPPEAVSFDERATKMTYPVKLAGNRWGLVVRDLATGRESEIDPGPGVLTSASLDASGHWVTVNIVAKDTNGDGEVEAPAQRTSVERSQCVGPVAIDSADGAHGDQPEVRLARVSGGHASARADVIGSLGNALMIRQSDGSIVLERGRGSRVELVPAACRGRVVLTNPERGAVLVGCERDALTTQRVGSREPVLYGRLELHTVGLHRALGPHVLVDRNRESFESTLERFAMLDIREGGALIDFETSTALRIDKIDAVYGSRVLGRKLAHSYVFDALGTSQRCVGTHGYLLPSSERFVTDQSRVIDLASGSVFAAPRERKALAVSNDGRVLIHEKAEPAASEVAYGALRWVRPRRVRPSCN